ncbi:unnamed protein product [Angiostrongylus costaricensis]|uniref:Uncharacterized protein n=1 Tax=Angiostrongylus costaricensis TaxID=334426 RepID=A0A158PKR0_ANGCS|nr:unnamed protein product [Angiostrongylus costaricensis]
MNVRWHGKGHTIRCKWKWDRAQFLLPFKAAKLGPMCSANRAGHATFASHLGDLRVVGLSVSVNCEQLATERAGAVSDERVTNRDQQQRPALSSASFQRFPKQATRVQIVTHLEHPPTLAQGSVTPITGNHSVDPLAGAVSTMATTSI